MNRSFSDGWSARRTGPNWPAIALIVALHGLGLFALLQLSAVREQVAEVAPLFVSFLVAPSAPKPEQPKPKPVVAPPKPAPRLIARTTPEPSAVQAIEAKPTEAPTPVQEETPPPSPAAEAPAAVVPPNFVAAYLDNPAPDYPPLSRHLQETGHVLLRVYVSPEGRAEKVEISKSSTFDRLDKAALDTVRKWRFVPAKQGTQAVAAWVLVPINFNLD